MTPYLQRYPDALQSTKSFFNLVKDTVVQSLKLFLASRMRLSKKWLFVLDAPEFQPEVAV